MAKTSAPTCPTCGSDHTRIFHRVRGAPVNSCLLIGSRQEALRFAKGNIELAFCGECGFVFNAAFDHVASEYSQRYEETQGFSPTFQAFHERLARRLIDKYDLRNKDVIEIGCGKGEFLNLLCRLGTNRGVGFDPGYVEERRDHGLDGQVEVIRDFYCEKYAHYQADFVCCKMTLEHIADTQSFSRAIHRLFQARPNGVVFFQVPDAARILRQCAFEDIYYEHCSYFTAYSLRQLFEGCGFQVLDVSTEYGGQYLTIEAKPGRPLPSANDEDLARCGRYVTEFPVKWKAKQDLWNRRFAQFRRAGRRVVLWGSGSKAVSMLTSLEIRDAVEFVVDINPYRHGFFMPATGQEIVSPESLKQVLPNVVIIMNRIYRHEIEKDLRQMDLDPEVLVL